MFRNGFVFRLIGVLLLLGLVATGGFMAYKMGIAQGIAQAPEVAAAIEKSAENGGAAPIAPMAGYGYPHGFYGYGHPHHFFNPFGAICFSLFFLFFFFGLMKMVFFRRMRHGWAHHGQGPWGRDWEGKVPPFFADWHKRAHGEEPADADAEKKE